MYTAEGLKKTNWNPDGNVFTCDDGNTVIVHAPEIDPYSVDLYFYIVDENLPWASATGYDGLAKCLNTHGAQVADREKEIAQLHEYFEKHQREGWDDDSWSWYSDWHKDAFGYRPHGRVCGEYVRPW